MNDNQKIKQAEEILESLLDHKKFLADPASKDKFSEMTRDMTLGNITKAEQRVILIHENQIAICNSLGLVNSQNFFERKIASILNTSRSVDGFCHRLQNTNINELKEITPAQKDKSIKGILQGFGGRKQ